MFFYCFFFPALNISKRSKRLRKLKNIQKLHVIHLCLFCCVWPSSLPIDHCYPSTLHGFELHDLTCLRTGLTLWASSRMDLWRSFLAHCLVHILSVHEDCGMVDILWSWEPPRKVHWDTRHKPGLRKSGTLNTSRAKLETTKRIKRYRTHQHVVLFVVPCCTWLRLRLLLL